MDLGFQTDGGGEWEEQKRGEKNKEEILKRVITKYFDFGKCFAKN